MTDLAQGCWAAYSRGMPPRLEDLPTDNPVALRRYQRLHRASTLAFTVVRYFTMLLQLLPAAVLVCAMVSTRALYVVACLFLACVPVELLLVGVMCVLDRATLAACDNLYPNRRP